MKRKIRKILRALTFPYIPELSLLFVNDERIRQLNLRYRGIDRATDILSFPAGEEKFRYPRNEVLGDIVISLPAVMRQSRERNLTFYEELDSLLIHGILHLFGYTHESENEFRKMRRKERQIATYLKTEK